MTDVLGPETLADLARKAIEAADESLAMPETNPSESQARNVSAIRAHGLLEECAMELGRFRKQGGPHAEERVESLRQQVLAKTKELLQDVFSVNGSELADMEEPRERSSEPAATESFTVSSANIEYIESHRRKVGLATLDDALTDLLNRVPQPVSVSELIGAFDDFVEGHLAADVGSDEVEGAQDIIRRARQIGVVHDDR